MAMKKTRAQIVADYQKKFDSMKVTRGPAVEAAAKRILAHWDAYKEVEATTGVPAQFVGVLHMRECNNDMRGCLHNGQRIIGTGRKTTIVPKGRGPFKTWVEAAVDALKFDGFMGMTDTSPGALCEAGERYNGTGYRQRGRPSPYVWAGSQFYSSGKYVRDGVYSAKTVDPQLGIAPVMKRVMELAPAGRSWLPWSKPKPLVIPAADPPKDTPVPVPVPTPPPTLSKEEKKAIVKSSEHLTWQQRYQNFLEIGTAIGTGIMAFTGQIKAVFSDPMALAMLGVLAGIIVATWVVLYRSKLRAFRQYLEGRYFPSKMAASASKPA